MANEEGKATPAAPALGYELIERASEHCEQVYGRLALQAVVDPQPRDFARAALELRDARIRNELPELPREIMRAAFWFLVPPAER